jgi:hypothetical protein
MAGQSTGAGKVSRIRVKYRKFPVKVPAPVKVPRSRVKY